MLLIVKGWDPEHASLMDAAFRFRHEAFVEEAGWENLRRADGREIDQFDTDDTIHVIIERSGSIMAYSRLNPTTSPHVLSEVYPQLASRGLIRNPWTWEWSRMATSKNMRNAGHGWNSPIGLLCRAIAVTALQQGIDTLIWQAHPVWITRASELGFKPEPMGLPLRIGNERVVAAKMDVTTEVLERMDSEGVPGFATLAA